MAVASRRTLPPREIPRTISSRVGFAWFVALPVVVGVAAWVFHVPLIAVVCGSWLLVVFIGILAIPIDARRERRLAAERVGESTCTFARSFDFRRVDTRVMRAVYEGVQSYVRFPIRASDHLTKDLRLDDEDLSLDIIPDIAHRTGRSLDGYEANPYYGQADTVGGLVHFLASQPLEHTEKTQPRPAANRAPPCVPPSL